MSLDRITTEERSRIMRRVQSTNTAPEKAVRRLLTSLSVRYRLGTSYRYRGAKLPGSPDLVLPGRRVVVFVHGCFWHRHSCRSGRAFPAANSDYWREKFARNQKRDRASVRRLRAIGWQPMIVWECQLRNPKALRQRFTRLLERLSNHY